jgi:ATP-dependent exoDNAse (exonuclease V) beta subunit
MTTPASASGAPSSVPQSAAAPAGASSSSFPQRAQPFSVFQASAGAGKTYRLVYEYVDLALRGVLPGSILAMTFTNKAAGEMRERVLAVLEDLAGAPEHWSKWKSMGEQLASERNWTPQEVQGKAQVALRKTLHDYGAVSIQTLDKFALRLVKTFRYDLRVPDGFSVELNEKLLQQEAVQRVLDQVGVDPELTALLEAYVRANLEDEKSWDATRALETVSEHLSRESSRPHWEALAEVPMERMQAWALELRAEVAQADARIRREAAEAFAAIEATGIPHEEFSNGSVPKWFREAAQAGYKKEPSDTVLKMLRGAAPYLRDSKKSNAANEALLDAMGTKAALADAFEAIEAAYSGSLRARFFAKHAFATGVLQALAVAYEAVCVERGVQPLSKFNSLIYKELVQQNGEYLLERLGSRFRHFFIDEAQDTSRVQWENLYPLLDHALSSQEYGQSGTALVVGDGKQSIYRWRNSEAEQFLEVTARAARHEPPKDTLPAWKGRTERLILGENWRSKQELVGWNNRFFAAVGGALKGMLHRTAYAPEAVEQVPKGREGGWIQVRTAAGKTTGARMEHIMDDLVDQLRSYAAAGWRWKDLAVLVRNNKQGAAVVERLVDEKIEVFSADSLMLGQSVQVNFWMAALAAAHQPQSRLARAELAIQAGRAGAWRPTAHLPTHHALELAAEREGDFWAAWRELFPQWNNAQLRTEGLYAGAESVVRWSGLAPDAYGLAWLSLVLRFGQQSTNAWDAFQEAWERELQTQSIALPDGLDAVVVMTVHKSKGLEFECVFVPFAVNSGGGFGGPSPVWVPSGGDWAGQGADLPTALVPVRTGAFASFVEGVPVLQDTKTRLEEEEAFDNLNVWYVAFTRPKASLVVWAQLTEAGKPYKEVAAALVSFAEAEGKGPEGPWQWGTPPVPAAGKQADGVLHAQPLQSLVFSAWTDRVQVLPERDADSSSARWLGEQFHRVMQYVHTAADVEPAVARVAANEVEARVLRAWAEGVVAHSDAAPWFDPAAQVLNERALLAPGSSVLRPDRVVSAAGRWAVMDYKTGKPQPAHREQVEGYANRLEGAVGQPVKRLLVYLRAESIPEVHVW